jgi:hypothetical protein
VSAISERTSASTRVERIEALTVQITGQLHLHVDVHVFTSPACGHGAGGTAVGRDR